MQRAICSKMWTDLDIRLPASRISNCCKSHEKNFFNPQEIKEMGSDLFNNRKRLSKNKRVMIKEDKLPWDCRSCAQVFPGGYFGGNNEWLNLQWNRKTYNKLKTDLTHSIEIMYSTTCNMTCMYCGPLVSSLWADVQGLPKNEPQQEWQDAVFEELYQYLPTLERRISFNFTGGEPLLELSIFDVIDNIGKSVNKEYKHNMMITTNLNIKPKLLERFFEVVENNPHFNWNLCISMDEVGNSAVRDGLVWSRFENNIKQVCKNKNFYFIGIIPTLTNLNAPGLSEVVKYVQELDTLGSSIVCLQNNLVDSPLSLSLLIAPQRFQTYLKAAADLTNDANFRHKRFLLNEIRNIGSQRNKETIAKAKEWFAQQEKWKGVKYREIYPHLVEILDE